MSETAFDLQRMMHWLMQPSLVPNSKSGDDHLGTYHPPALWGEKVWWVSKQDIFGSAALQYNAVFTPKNLVSVHP